MCVDGHGVGALDAPQALTAPGGQGEEPAVRGVDVEPGAGVGGDVGHAVERVDAAGVRAARGGDDEDGVRPADASASIAPASACVSHRPSASAATVRIASGGMPTSRAA